MLPLIEEALEKLGFKATAEALPRPAEFSERARRGLFYQAIEDQRMNVSWSAEQPPTSKGVNCVCPGATLARSSRKPHLLGGCRKHVCAPRGAVASCPYCGARFTAPF